ncbi:MAG: inorganic phosphate transporter [Thermoplasmata archaeon]|nr:inorganic phosphate transporter [Thermoplasmata archaeon]MBE3137964.1 inorganic phosphate transporter [Thermoplasmata archaeon]MBE3138976.1 inorganic phosphate transporter [Thermoplasmata archaeon]
MSELTAILSLSPFVIFLIFLALVFDFLNGMNDSANSIATVVSTRVLKPVQAVSLAAFFNFVAAFGVPLLVARTIGIGIIDPRISTPILVFCALLGAIVWTATATHWGLPISVSHALIGGLIGAGIAAAGIGVIQDGLWKVLVFMIISPFLGLVIGFFFMIAVLWIIRRKSQSKVDGWFRRLQLISASAFSFSHGTNDAQKTMGIIFYLLLGTGYFASLGVIPGHETVPIWVILSAHTAIACGTLFGGWGVIKTLGQKVAKLRPVHGFAAETSAAGTIICCSFAGIPVSTTHTITGSIIGVGSAKRASAVRWGVTRNIVWAWLLTIPISAVIGYVSYSIIFLFL